MAKFRFLILLVILISIVSVIWYFDSKEYDKWDVLLNNSIVIKGKVLNIKNSHNHDFGIVLVVLDSTNLKEFSGRTDSSHVIYPYRIKNGRAELYFSIPNHLAIGDKIIMNSNKRGGSGYDGDTLSQEKVFSIEMLRDYNSTNYVRDNTDLK